MALAESRDRNASSLWGTFLILGATCAALTEAVAGTAISIARVDMMGGVHAGVDEFAKLDYGYTAAKLIGFAITPWLAGHYGMRTVLVFATAVMTIACGLMLSTTNLDYLCMVRLAQGLAGGVLLVSGQALLFQTFVGRNQPFVQTAFALGAVVAPATVAPFTHGWLLDNFAWSWIFGAIVPVGMIALLFLLLVGGDSEEATQRRPFDFSGVVLFSVAAFAVTYVLNQGNRWDWFRDDNMVVILAVGLIAIGVLVYHIFATKSERKVLDFSIFRNGGFSFGLMASLAAGFALLGSSYLIPAFSISILKLTPTAAGALLLPSTLMFAATLLFTAVMVRNAGMSPALTIPLGILGLMTSMFLLSGSTSESGLPDMLPAVLLRGAALGFLFLSITLITMMGLGKAMVVYGVALFNIGRQMGGLFGIAFLQTFVEDQAAQNRAVLAAHVMPGRWEVSGHVFAASKYLASRGLETGAAAKVAASMLGKQVALQSTTIAFNSAFMAVCLFFLGAAPILVISKILIGKAIAAHAARMRGRT